MNLLDTIRQNQNLASQPQGLSDQSNQIQTMLRAKSGKAVGGAPVAASNLQEQQAVAQTNQGLQQLGSQATAQRAGIQQQQQGQQQQLKQQTGEIAQSRKFDTIQTQIKVDQTLNDLERNKGQIDQQRQQASMEQVASTLRLQNQQYVDNLQREGNKARLDNQLQFQQQLQQDILGSNQDTVKKMLANRDILAVNDRDFKQAMSNMDTDHAWEVLNNEMQAQKDRTFFQSMGSMGTAGAGAYGASQDKSKNSGSQDGTTTTGVDTGTGGAGEGTATV